ncbi:MAG: fatty acid desaturase [Pseudomonadota bacterium]|nr:fatty acid desaturase [Pseudomonadota bacterium]
MENYIYGLMHLGFWQMLLVFIFSFMLSMMSITLYLHRDQAHRSIELHPVLRHFFRFWIWMNSGAQTDEWVAVHRKHHALCEQEGDPHSPQIFGIRRVLLEGAELYQTEAERIETVEKYSEGTPNDWIELNLYKRYRDGGILLLVILSLSLFGTVGIIFLGFQLISMPIFAAGIINGAGHYWGYRNFETEDASTNLIPTAFIIGGEELHNNHHAFPTSAKFSILPYEFDIGWMYISIFRTLGLCQVRRLAPRPILRKCRSVDIETLQAVLVNRMHVLRDYTCNVTLFEWRRERIANESDVLLQKARKYLVSRPARLDLVTTKKLNLVLEASDRLKLVHELRERLADIWEQANVSNDHLVAQLKQWCTEAEASGIKSLEEFSTRLRCYIPQSETALIT